MVGMNWHIVGTQAVPSTIVALVRVVALLIPWDYQGVIHPIGKSLLTNGEYVSLFAYGYFVALVPEKSTNQDCFRGIFTYPSIRGVSFSYNKYE